MSSAHSPDARQKVYARDDWTCRGCGFRQTEDERRRVAERGGLGRYLTLDHIVPRSKGGRNAMENLQVLCNVCNGEKADTLDPADALPSRIRKKLSRSKHLARLHRGRRGELLIHDRRCDATFCMDTCPVFLENGVHPVSP